MRPFVVVGYKKVSEDPQRGKVVVCNWLVAIGQHPEFEGSQMRGPSVSPRRYQLIMS